MATQEPDIVLVARSGVARLFKDGPANPEDVAAARSNLETAKIMRTIQRSLAGDNPPTTAQRRDIIQLLIDGDPR